MQEPSGFARIYEPGPGRAVLLPDGVAQRATRSRPWTVEVAMAKPAKESVAIRDFPGLATKPDPDDLPPGGAVIQINCMSNRPGQLRVRPGYQPLTFEAQ